MRGAPAPRAAPAPDLVTSLYLWGPNRGEVNRLASGAAQGMDPRFAWVEVSAPEVEEPPADSAERAIVAPTRAFAPPPGVSANRMRACLRQNRQRRAVQELQNFLKMSEPIQQAIGRLLERDGPRVLVVANLERLRGFFCEEEEGPHPFVQWLNAREITLVASSTGGPLREGVHFDYLATRPGAARTAPRSPVVAICQRGDPDSSFLQRIFRPHEVVCLSGLSPTTPPAPRPVVRVATA
jgi:hypothetical protein